VTEFQFLDALPTFSPSPRMLTEQMEAACQANPGRWLVVRDFNDKPHASGRAATARKGVQRYIKPGFTVASRRGMVLVAYGVAGAR
jgi:hypothetical protein